MDNDPHFTPPPGAGPARDGYLSSVWQDAAAHGGSPVPAPTETVDVVVVGAGITGLSTGLALVQAGMRCVITEAHTVGFGTTGGTSAHINTILDLPYDRMIHKFGEDAARTVAQGTIEAYDRLRDWSAAFAPECQWTERDAYIFAQNDAEAAALDSMVEATRKVGLSAHGATGIPITRSFLKAARFPHQAQFHPLRYLQGVAKAYVRGGGVLLEHCGVTRVEEEKDFLRLLTDRGELRARSLIYATHVPPGVNVLHFRNAPYRSYVLSARLRTGRPPLEALVYDMEEPYHYYRSHAVDGRTFLIAGGHDHKTGDQTDTEQPFRDLEAHVRAHFDVEAVTHRWSSQYYEPVDGLPYIGPLPMADERIFVATGYNGNGIPLGTLASIVLSDLIRTGQSPYAAVFSPARVSPVAGFSNFVKEAADVVGHLIAAPFPAPAMEELDALARGDGKVVRHHGHAIAVHRDAQGGLHAVDPACSHIKCTVAWNKAERSWDCPCHGSRFSPLGEVLNAPARKPLRVIHLETGT